MKLINPDDGGDVKIGFPKGEEVKELVIKRNEQKEFDEDEGRFLKERFGFLIDPEAPEEKKMVEYSMIPDEVWIALNFHKKDLLDVIRKDQLNVIP
jgi:hypothetical protein